MVYLMIEISEGIVKFDLQRIKYDWEINRHIINDFSFEIIVIAVVTITIHLFHSGSYKSFYHLDTDVQNFYSSNSKSEIETIEV